MIREHSCSDSLRIDVDQTTMHGAPAQCESDAWPVALVSVMRSESVTNCASVRAVPMDVASVTCRMRLTIVTEPTPGTVRCRFFFAMLPGHARLLIDGAAFNRILAVYAVRSISVAFDVDQQSMASRALT